MAFKMNFNKEEVEGLKPVSPGIYNLLLIGFKPKKSKAGDSVNLNAQAKIIGNSEFENRMVFASLNTKIPGFIQDFVHSFGIEMEDQNGENPGIPGIFDGDVAKFNEADPTTWAYRGPLTGQVAQWELGLRDYEGNPTQDIAKFICKVPQCAQRFPKVRHSKDMRKKP
jgi:hypothetical protein